MTMAVTVDGVTVVGVNITGVNITGVTAIESLIGWLMLEMVYVHLLIWTQMFSSILFHLIAS